MINNQRHSAEKIHDQAIRITRLCGDNRTLNPLAINSAQYNNCEKSQKLGHITEYHGLGHISDLLKIPLPFLRENQFIRKNRNDDLFNRITGQDRERMRNQRNNFRDMYAQIARNIITLVEHDRN